MTSRASLVFLLVACLATRPAAARVCRVVLRGAVVDQSSAALPGVKITATHTESGTARTTVTTETGAYVMPALSTGSYDVKAELTGFSTLIKGQIGLALIESRTLNFALKLATVQETVTLLSAFPIIVTKYSDLSGTVEHQQS